MSENHQNAISKLMKAQRESCKRNQDSIQAEGLLQHEAKAGNRGCTCHFSI